MHLNTWKISNFRHIEKEETKDIFFMKCCCTAIQKCKKVENINVEVSVFFCLFFFYVLLFFLLYVSLRNCLGKENYTFVLKELNGFKLKSAVLHALKYNKPLQTVFLGKDRGKTFLQISIQKLKKWQSAFNTCWATVVCLLQASNI